MYRWLKAYIRVFGKDFPVSAVANLNEYEICRIIQHCIEQDTEYSADSGSTSPPDSGEENEPIVGKAVVDKTHI